MTKEYSRIIKGIAILMMLYLHLFNDPGRASTLFCLISFNGIPLSHILTRAAGPVEFFLILGGYGLYATYKIGTDKHRFSRILKCYLAYWCSLLFFVPLVCWLINDPDYPGTLNTAFLSITGFETIWYREAWFLLPYMMLSAIYPLLMMVLDKLRSLATLIVSFVLYAFTVLITQRDYIDIGQDSPYILTFVHMAQFLFPFYLGSVLCKEKLLDKVRKIQFFRNERTVFLSLVVVIVLRCCFSTYFFIAPVYALLCIILISSVNIQGSVRVFLLHIGKYSLLMWMVHAWIYKYLFPDFIYSFHFPIIIFIVLCAVSYAISRVLNWIIPIRL